MTHKFEGPCMDGPLKGQSIIWDQTTYTVVKGPSILFEEDFTVLGAKKVANQEVSVVTVIYEWHSKSQTWWVK